jgi:hypothetical protein
MHYQFWNGATSLLYTTNISTDFLFVSGAINGSIASPIILQATAAVPEPADPCLVIVGLLTYWVISRFRKPILLS